MSKCRAVIVASAVGAAVLAAPAIGLGDITGTVFRDYNSNGVKNAGGFVSGSGVAATDAAMGGVVVRAFNNSGVQVGQTTTAPDGTYSLPVSASGTVRVEFSTPPGFQPSFKGGQAQTSVQFVDSSASNVDYAVNVPGEYCQDNPQVVTCRQPAADQMTVAQSTPGLVSMPAAFGSAQTFTDWGGVYPAQSTALKTGVTTVATLPNIGATFGIGVDRAGSAYLGTYVKRFSPYGPAGATNTIYRVDLATGATSTFITLPGTLPAHSAVAPTGYPDYSQDGRRNLAPGDAGYSNVYTQVGRAGLGDVDVAPDGSTVYAVEMTQGASKFWTIPIVRSGGSVQHGSESSIAIDPPTTFAGVACIGNWHPMGIGVRGDTVLVGGVCGGTETQATADASPTANSRTNAAAFILSLNGSKTGFDTVAAFSLGYAKGQSYQANTLGAWNAPQTGLWHNWYDGPPANPGSFQGWGIPMLANIEIMDDGDLTVAFRDRWQDQIKPSGVVSYEWNGSGSVVQQGGGQAAAEIIRLCTAGDGWVRESAGACNGVTGANLPVLPGNASRDDSPLYYGSAWYCSFGNCGGSFQAGAQVFHPYTSLGGVAALPGSPVVWASVYDITSYWEQAVRALGPCAARTGDGNCGPAGAADGAMIGGAMIDDNVNAPSVYKFAKGNGLGDLELVCNAAPLQIGNRVWIDLNRNGLQDPREAPVAGVTVHLYDELDVLVGTAITAADGTYYFSSNVTQGDPTLPVGGSGNVGAGLVAGKAFTIRLDNPADFTGGGPLEPYVLTTANVATAPAGAQATAINSKATEVDDYPQISVAARQAGFNNHTFDVGFYDPDVVPPTPVGMGDYTWVDSNRNGIQDAGEPPLPGVVVQLLAADGSGPATDIYGNAVSPVTTDANGYYFVGDLPAGSYKAQFTIPSGYVFTTPNAGTAGTDSVATPTSGNPLVGMTAIFEIADSATGNTTPVTEPNASFANLTIDAGVVQSATDPSTTPVGMGDYTWIDTNRNGIQDPGEQPLPGVKVELLNPDGSPAKDITGSPVAPVYTDITGRYLIVNLMPGSYMARFTIPTGYTFTKAGAGVPGTDSNPNVFNGFVGTTPVFQIAASATGTTTQFIGNAKALFANLTIDAGVVPLVAVGNYVWYDTTKDGIQGRNEKPVRGAKVYLLNPDGTRARDAYGKVLPVLTTNAKGKYQFNGLLPGSYKVKFIYPRGYTGTMSGRGTAKTGSNPKSTKLNRRVALTPTFTVYDMAKGNTVPQTNPTVNAKYIDPTIDAGLVVDTGGPQVVTG